LREAARALLPRDPNGRLAEVELGLAGWVRQRDEDLAGMTAVAGDRFLHLGDAAFIAVLIAQALEDAFGGSSVLGQI
jgi:hypothetical protein